MSTPTQTERDEQYELTRVTDRQQFLQKMLVKRRLYRWFGEIYIGRRAKFLHFRRWLARLGVPDGARVLEVGSGDGVYCFYMAAQYPKAQVVGLELNPTEVEVCQTIAEREALPNLRFADGVLGPPWNNSCDLLYSLDVLEHISDDVGVMRQMFDALADGGHLLVHVPSRVHQETDGRMISMPDEDAWKINLGHVRQGYAPEELDAKLTAAGFDVKEIQPTQSQYMSYAHRLYARVEHALPMRILILPILDVLIFLDARRKPEHGNTVWAWAQKPAGSTPPRAE